LTEDQHTVTVKQLTMILYTSVPLKLITNYLHT